MAVRHSKIILSIQCAQFVSRPGSGYCLPVINWCSVYSLLLDSNAWPWDMAFFSSGKGLSLLDCVVFRLLLLLIIVTRSVIISPWGSFCGSDQIHQPIAPFFLKYKLQQQILILYHQDVSNLLYFYFFLYVVIG